MKNTFYKRKYAACILLALGGATTEASAQTLVNAIDNLFGSGGLVLQQSNSAFPETHFISSSFSQLGNLTSTLAASSADFPVVSTAPGMTFSYNSELNTFEAVRANNGGSLYVEGGKTLGEGKIAVGVNYAYVDYQTLNGNNLNGTNISILHQQSPFESGVVNVNFNRFNITSSVISSYFTYGITEKWDVNILLPVMVTDLSMQATATVNNAGEGIFPYYFNTPGKTVNTYSATGHKVGVGDLQLRTKYNFFAAEGLNMSGLLKVRFPTGDAANFQGIGDYLIQPYLAVSQIYGDFDFHTNAGIDVDLTVADRSRARYGLGVSYQFVEMAKFMVDVIGSSNVTSQALSAQVPQYSLSTGAYSGTNTITSQLTTNIVDLSMGIKATPTKSLTTYINFLVPMTNDGLRTGFTPVAGIEMPL